MSKIAEEYKEREPRNVIIGESRCCNNGARIQGHIDEQKENHMKITYDADCAIDGDIIICNKCKQPIGTFKDLCAGELYKDKDIKCPSCNMNYTIYFWSHVG